MWSVDIVCSDPECEWQAEILLDELEGMYPVAFLAGDRALAIAIMSYNGRMNFGLIGDFDAMADLESFALDLEEATAEVIASAPAGPGGRNGRAKAPASANGTAVALNEG